MVWDHAFYPACTCSTDDLPCPLAPLVYAGLVTNIINGGLECGKGTVMDKEQSRIGHFERHAGLLGVTTGANLNCANQSSYV
jgi:hypothetical protein